jgi:hypothetical protein
MINEGMAQMGNPPRPRYLSWFGTKITAYAPEFKMTTPFGRAMSGLFWDAERSRRTHSRLAAIWTPTHYTLGVLGAVLAAIAGVTGLTDTLGKNSIGVDSNRISCRKQHCAVCR